MPTKISTTAGDRQTARKRKREKEIREVERGRKREDTEW